ncbi:MAG TPA: hypothetical protein VJ201_03990 [Candidatus Babeliales bacterium]|nr:hypothetical protein [Candidatus Babeliales bacterium]
MNSPKFIIVTLSLLFSVYSFNYSVDDAKELNPNLEKLASGNLSEENQKIIYDAAEKLGIKDIKIHLKQPSIEFRLVQPIGNYFLPILSANGCAYYFIHETWFNTLTNDEKRFIAGLGLQGIFEAVIKQKKNSLQINPLFIVAGVNIACAVGMYQFLISQKFGKLPSMVIGYLSMLIVGNSSMMAINKIKKIRESRDAIGRVRDIVCRLDVFDAAISVYEKLYSEWKKHAENEPKYWDANLQIINVILSELKNEQVAKIA